MAATDVTGHKYNAIRKVEILKSKVLVGHVTKVINFINLVKKQNPHIRKHTVLKGPVTVTSLKSFLLQNAIFLRVKVVISDYKLVICRLNFTFYS